MRENDTKTLLGMECRQIISYEIYIQCLIDVPPLINFSIFFHPGHSYSNPPTPPPCLLFLGKVSNPDKLFETIYLC